MKCRTSPVLRAGCGCADGGEPMMRLFPSAGSFWFTVLATLIVAAGVGLTIAFWGWLHSGTPADVSNSTTLRNVGLLVGGVLALLFAVWRSLVAERQSLTAQRQADIAQQSLLNERYERGAEMLGSNVLAVRMGGIYALTRLAEDYPEQYSVQIMELFCAFARNPTESTENRNRRDTEEPEELARPSLRDDVQAVMTAIGGRNDMARRENFSLNLEGADLGGMRLDPANLAGANLRGANLVYADLLNANLSGAELAGANLHHALMPDANLSGIRMMSANLSWVNAEHANLSDANLARVNLSHANLGWATLSGVNIGTADMSNALLGYADLSRAKIGTPNLSGAVLVCTNLSGAVFGRETPMSSEEYIIRLTQSQLDYAKADSDNPPQIYDGTLDTETGEPLVWRGGQGQPSTVQQVPSV